VKDAVLIRAAEPLRSHLHDLLAGQNRATGQLRVVQRVRHRLLAVAVLPRSYHLREDSRVLVIARSDHDRVESRVGQHLLGVLKRLRPLPEQPLRIVGRPLAIHRPEVADAAQVEIGVGRGGHLEHLAVARRPMSAADLADLDPVVRPENPRVRTRGQQHRTGGEEISA
jgi:hypothetical protein